MCCKFDTLGKVPNLYVLKKGGNTITYLIDL